MFLYILEKIATKDLLIYELAYPNLNKKRKRKEKKKKKKTKNKKRNAPSIVSPLTVLNQTYMILKIIEILLRVYIYCMTYFFFFLFFLN